MTTHRAQPFLAAFNDIEDYLRDEIDAEHTDGFTWMVKQARRRGLLSDSQEDKLKDYAYLRNAIAHGLYYENEPIAEPAEQVVEDITALRDLLLSPPAALSVLGPKRVISLSPEDHIRKALRYIEAESYMQFPVYSDGVFQHLLTANTIAKWVAAEAITDQVLESTLVKEVLRYGVPGDKAVFLPRTATALEVIQALSVVANDGTRAYAVLLTEVGDKDQKPLRVITAMDLSQLYKEVT